MRQGRDLALIIFIAVFGIMAPIGWLPINPYISWSIRILLILVGVFLVINFPLLRLVVSEIGTATITKQDVLSAYQTNTWQTVLEAQRQIERQFKKHVSLRQVMDHTYALVKEKVLVGRERFPPQAAFFSGGNIWEYSYKLESRV